MTPPDAFVAGLAELLTGWGFTLHTPLEGNRAVPSGTQRLQCHVTQRQQAKVWNVTLMATSSFFVDPSANDDVWSFKAAPHLLDRTRRAHGKLREHTVEPVLKALKKEYAETLEPFLTATSTPAGLIRWMA